MIVLVFILILLIGFLLFNPLKVNQDTLGRQTNNSFAGFCIYCVVCIGLLGYFLIGEKSDFLDKIANNNSKQDEITPQEIQQSQEKPKSNGNSINFAILPSNSKHTISIRELSDFDGKRKSELYAQRKAIVDSFNGLGGDNYQPSEEIFGGIRDGKPWWGTEGILCKGQGKHASDGMSRESSYFNNPFLLLNLGLGRVMNGNKILDNEYLISKKDLAKQFDKYSKNTPEGQLVRCFYDGKNVTKLFEQIAYIGHAWGKWSNNYIDFGELVDGFGIDRNNVDNATISLKDIQDSLHKADANFVVSNDIDASAKFSISQLFSILGGIEGSASDLLLIADRGSKIAGNDSTWAECSNLWPEPETIIVSNNVIRADYNLQKFMENFEGTFFYDNVNETDWFEFGNINARDFGYVYAQAYETKGIRFAHTPNVSTGARLINYWCLGQSCQIEGGCNNICPSNNPFTFFVDSYPAYAKFKLYKTEPASGSKPDAYFEIYLN